METKRLVTIDPGDKWATFSKRTLASQAVGEFSQPEKQSAESSANHSELRAGVCRLPLHTDLDKFKMSVSIFYGSLISRSSSWPGAAAAGGLDGLGDDYSGDHLFSEMRSSSKRLREREVVGRKRRGRSAELWRATWQADSISLTAPN